MPNNTHVLVDPNSPYSEIISSFTLLRYIFCNLSSLHSVNFSINKQQESVSTSLHEELISAIGDTCSLNILMIAYIMLHILHIITLTAQLDVDACSSMIHVIRKRIFPPM